MRRAFFSLQILYHIPGGVSRIFFLGAVECWLLDNIKVIENTKNDTDSHIKVDKSACNTENEAYKGNFCENADGGTDNHHYYELDNEISCKFCHVSFESECEREKFFEFVHF